MAGELVPWRELDAAESAALAVDEVRPRYLGEPSSYDEAAQAVARAAEQGLAVVPRGAGSGMGLGFPPAAADLVLSTARLSRVVAYEPADLTLTVEAGIRLGELQQLLGERGQFLALDPPGPAEATLGGIIATNASGPLRLAYGTARDLVIGTRVVNADGQVTRAGGRVVKNVAGYDLNKLYVGSLGTLGVVVELSLKLHPLPERCETVAAAFADLDAVRQALREVLRSPLNPQCLELLDTGAASAIGLEVAKGAYVLLARAAGFARAVERQTRDLGTLFRERGGVALAPPVDEPGLWAAVRDLAYGPQGSVLARASVPLAETVGMLDELRRAAAARGLSLTTLAHAGSGIVYGRLEAFPEREAWLEAVARCLAEARQAAVAKGGSLVVEAAPAALKLRFDVWGEVGPSFQVMQALKRALDPKGTLNPGRYVGRL